jgi:hypothetical protein
VPNPLVFNVIKGTHSIVRLGVNLCSHLLRSLPRYYPVLIILFLKNGPVVILFLPLGNLSSARRTKGKQSIFDDMTLVSSKLILHFPAPPLILENHFTHQSFGLLFTRLSKHRVIFLSTIPTLSPNQNRVRRLATPTTDYNSSEA